MSADTYLGISEGDDLALEKRILQLFTERHDELPPNNQNANTKLHRLQVETMTPSQYRTPYLGCNQTL